MSNMQDGKGDARREVDKAMEKREESTKMSVESISHPLGNVADRLAKVKIEWLAGNGTQAELAEKYDLPRAAVEHASSREGWMKEAREKAQEIEEKVKLAMVGKAKHWIERTVERSEKWRERIDETVSQIGGAVDPDAIRSLVASEKVVDDLARRALGLPDAPSTTNIDLSTGGQPLQIAIMNTLKAVGALQEAGKLNTRTIDIEALKTASIDDVENPGSDIPSTGNQLLSTGAEVKKPIDPDASEASEVGAEGPPPGEGEGHPRAGRAGE